MKFHDDIDKRLYELEQKALLEDGPKRLFVKAGDNSPMGAIKDFLKSRGTSHEWSRHRNKFMFAIRKYHRSMKGSSMHRKLGRFFDMRTGTQHTLFSALGEELLALRADLVGQRDYYHSLIERAELELLIDEISLALNS